MLSNWNEWLQAIAALFTAFAGPTLINRLWERTRKVLNVITLPRKPELGTPSTSWLLAIQSSREVRSTTHIYVFGRDGRGKVKYIQMLDGDSFGRNMMASIASNGDGIISIERMPAKSSAVFQVVLSRHDYIAILGSEKFVKHSRSEINVALRTFGKWLPSKSGIIRVITLERIFLVGTTLTTSILIIIAVLFWKGLARTDPFYWLPAI